MSDAKECWGCGGDRLSLTRYPATGYGNGPDRDEDRWLCEICADSLVVRRASVGGELPSAAEHDVLIGNHILLAAVREAQR